MLLGYIRCSTLEQTKGTSLDEQERVIRGMAMARGISAFDLQIFNDAGVSGSIPLRDRPAGKDLVARAKPGDTIVCSKLDRMFRDALDAQTMYGFFKKCRIDLIFFDMGTEPVTSDNSLAKFFFTMLSAFADLERGRIRERILEGKAAKKAMGGHTGGVAPYGFMIDGHGKSARLVENPDEQPILKFIADNKTRKTSTLQRMMRAHGFKTREGQDFQWVQIERIRTKIDAKRIGHVPRRWIKKGVGGVDADASE